MIRVIVPLLALAALAGCVPTQSTDTPVLPTLLTEPTTGEKYGIYVPSYYSADRAWPLVVTLHGTHGWDSSDWQMWEWQKVAEDHGLIVVAPKLKSVQGILPVTKMLHDQWLRDLDRDEGMILAVMEDVSKRYRIDAGAPGRRPAVLLTGFSAGGFPLYDVGLKHPTRFNMLIARACNSNLEILERTPVTDDLRRTPIMIYWGRDDLQPIHDQSWQAFSFLRTHNCLQTKHMKTMGGHLRHPEMAYDMWKPHLPAEYVR